MKNVPPDSKDWQSSPKGNGLPFIQALSSQHGSSEFSSLALETSLARGQNTIVLPEDWSALTLQSFMDLWLTSKQTVLKPKSWLQYRRTMERFVLKQIGHKQLYELKPIDFVLHYQTLNAQQVGARTIQLCHSILNQALSKALQWDLIEKNPLDKVDRPGVTHKRMEILDHDQIRTLLNSLPSAPYAQLFQLAICSGMRLGELLGLQWGDIDWNQATLRVARQLQRVPGQGLQLTSLKTQSSARTIQVGRKMLDELHKLKTEHLSQASTSRTPSSIVFLNTAGSPLLRRQVQRIFKKTLIAAGLPSIRFHDLRHTAASLMLNSGMPLIQVARQLGHAQTSTTLDIYGHFIPGLQVDLANQLEEVLFA